jgi:Mrp family chromosome partitioning ATPase
MPAVEAQEETRVPVLALSGELPDALLTTVAEGHRLIAVVGSSDLAATNDVTLALGQELAARGFSTLVVEGDMSHPTLATRLSIRSQAGLTDVLSGGATVERTQRQTSIVGLQVLPSGRAVERPDVLIGVDNVQRVLSTSSSDIVVVSLPPSMSPADRDALASQLHSVVVVVRDGRMRSRQVKAALSELEALHNTLVAVGLVDVVPNPEIEIIGRKADRSPRRTATSEPAPIRPSRAAANAAAQEASDASSFSPPETARADRALGPGPDPAPASVFASGGEGNGHRERADDAPAGDSMPQS